MSENGPVRVVTTHDFCCCYLPPPTSRGSLPGEGLTDGAPEPFTSWDGYERPWNDAVTWLCC